MPRATAARAAGRSPASRNAWSTPSQAHARAGRSPWRLAIHSQLRVARWHQRTLLRVAAGLSCHTTQQGSNQTLPIAASERARSVSFR